MHVANVTSLSFLKKVACITHVFLLHWIDLCDLLKTILLFSFIFHFILFYKHVCCWGSFVLHDNIPLPSLPLVWLDFYLLEVFKSCHISPTTSLQSSEVDIFWQLQNGYHLNAVNISSSHICCPVHVQMSVHKFFNKSFHVFEIFPDNIPTWHDIWFYVSWVS